jgi:hypothetical protein
MSKDIVRELETRWTTNKPGIEEALSKVMGWTDEQTDLRIHLLGWLATKTDEKIQQEALEMVRALETVAHTSNMTHDRCGEAMHNSDRQGGWHHDHQQGG